MELQAAPARIGQVRRIVSAQLRYWHLDPLIDPAALGVTELLTNVHRHAQPDKTCTVEIELLLDRLTVSVHDHDPRPPRVCAAEPYDTGGRGLALIEAVSDDWGVRQEGEEGKTVWFALPTAAPQPAVEPVPKTAPETSTVVALTPRPERERSKPDKHSRTARSAAVG
ncbi:ATPase [Streptomyces spiroverticillatus]|uniref:ATPase n=1 Tax=Streptomyces finlayi TaxID=67296 RepID=A0A918XA50_9ACTN|nr:ATPase [Streptomyces spiroverticillatus]GHD19071.1 ATPase [Streptomyces finlayi]